FTRILGPATGVRCRPAMNLSGSSRLATPIVPHSRPKPKDAERPTFLPSNPSTLNLIESSPSTQAALRSARNFEPPSAPQEISVKTDCQQAPREVNPVGGPTTLGQISTKAATENSPEKAKASLLPTRI